MRNHWLKEHRKIKVSQFGVIVYYDEQGNVASMVIGKHKIYPNYCTYGEYAAVDLAMSKADRLAQETDE